MSSPASTSPGSGQRLADLAAEVFAFALNLKAAKDPGDAEVLRQSIGGLFEKFAERARAAGKDSTEIDQVRYALCALLDEIVFSSKWELKTAWMSQPLQMIYFNDFTAGEQFYTRLEELRGKPGQIDIVEVYAQCLAVGFRGKFGDLAGMQKIADLLDQLNREIREARGRTDGKLSKSFQREAALPQAVKRVPVWIVAAGGAALLLVLLFVLDAILASQAATFLATGKGGQ